MPAKQEAGTQRTYKIVVRFRPQVKELIDEAMRASGLTRSAFVRKAVWDACKQPDDPREA